MQKVGKKGDLVYFFEKSNDCNVVNDLNEEEKKIFRDKYDVDLLKIVESFKISK